MERIDYIIVGMYMALMASACASVLFLLFIAAKG